MNSSIKLLTIHCQYVKYVKTPQFTIYNFIVNDSSIKLCVCVFSSKKETKKDEGNRVARVCKGISVCVLTSPGRLAGVILEGVTTGEVLTSSRKEGSVVDAPRNGSK